MTINGAVRVEEVTNCFLCDTAGTLFYGGLPDRLFGASGLWNFFRCPQCGLVWLNPRPVQEDIGKIYATYYTHVDAERRTRLLSGLREKIKRGLLGSVLGTPLLSGGWSWRNLGDILSFIPPLREAARLYVMCLDGIEKGRVLDVGCGSGKFLSLMRDAGWEVSGLDSDPAAVEYARQQLGIPVTLGSLPEAGIPDEAFDAVTLHHVIEHVYDPLGLLLDCRRVLKRKGRLVVITPNINSGAHQVFRESWRGLEPPRHFHLFSLSTLKLCFERSGLEILEIRTTARGARTLWAISHVIQTKGRYSGSDLNLYLLVRGLAFKVWEEIAVRKGRGVGEELLVVASY